MICFSIDFSHTEAMHEVRDFKVHFTVAVVVVKEVAVVCVGFGVV